MNWTRRCKNPKFFSRIAVNQLIQCWLHIKSDYHLLTICTRTIKFTNKTCNQRTWPDVNEEKERENNKKQNCDSLIEWEQIWKTGQIQTTRNLCRMFVFLFVFLFVFVSRIIFHFVHSECKFCLCTYNLVSNSCICICFMIDNLDVLVSARFFLFFPLFWKRGVKKS